MQKALFPFSIFLLCVIIIFLSDKIKAEIIYLKDGQVVKGSIIFENKQLVKIKTPYMVRTIKRSRIKRVLYGERDMEKIHILLKDYTIIQGFLVDQDAQKVIYRKTKTSAKDITILKSKIRQLSREEINLLNPEVYIKPGLFYPFNSGGAKVNPTYIIVAGTAINTTVIRNVRAYFETGYTRLDGSKNKDLYIQIIPLMFGLNYHIPIHSFDIFPRMGAGLTIVDFNNAEGDEFRGFDLFTSVGVEGRYEIIKRHVDIGIALEYSLLVEQEFQMHSTILSVIASYKF